MSRLTRLTLLLALPVAATACKNEDNETDAGVDETSAEGTVSTTATTGPTSSTSVSTTDSATTMPDTTTVDTGSGEQGTEDTGVNPACVSADDAASPKTELPALIDMDRTLTCDQVWVLTAATYVQGATLTIEPGTHIVGANGSALIVDIDARLDALGEASNPIVFTSAQPKGSRARADWGGVVLIGAGSVNLPGGTGVVEGIADPPSYGGNDPAHNCGTLEYVRVEWAGFELVEGSELNGITWYACGTATTVNNVQSHMGSDDAFEAFGGGFDGKNLIATGMADDSLDLDLGFQGTFQYVFVHQDPAETGGNHALEWSNGPDDFTATPLTSPSVANMTYIGQGAGGNAGKSIGFVIKEGAEAQVYNSYFANVTGLGAALQDQATIDVAIAGGIVVENTFWDASHAGFGHEGDPMPPLTWDDAMIGTFFTGGTGNMDGVDLMFDFTWTAPAIQPAAGSAADGVGSPTGGAFDATTYVGAVDPNGTDWTADGWINYAVD